MLLQKVFAQVNAARGAISADTSPRPCEAHSAAHATEAVESLANYLQLLREAARRGCHPRR